MFFAVLIVGVIYMWVSSILAIIAAALSIWESKEKRKYQDEKLSIEKAYYEEQNKPPEIRSDAVLDNLEFRLRILASALAADIGKPIPASIT